MALSKAVVAEDRKLAKASDKAGEALMKHRWHWTLDESNAKRVSFSEYGRSVGRGRTVINASAKGYALMREAESLPGATITADEARRRGNASSEREAAADAVAEVHGIGFVQADQSHRREVKDVLDIARDRAETHGTTVEEEAPDAAKRLEKIRKSIADGDADRKASPVLGNLTAGVQLSKARKALREVLNIARDVEEFDEDSVEHIEDGLERVRSTCDLIDLALTGRSEIDWDGELAKLAD
jgi:hypothetical protein